MASSARIDQIESKLAGLLAENCALCRQRADACPECGRAVGETQAEREAALEGFYAELDRLRIALEERSDG